MVDAVGLVDGLYPGAAAAGLRDFPESGAITPPRIAEVYTKGTLTLARLGREAPIAMANPAGPVLRNVEGGSLAARLLYPERAPVAAGGACRGPRSSARTRPSSTSSARTSAPPASGCRPTARRGRERADPGAIRVRARGQRGRRHRRPREARPRGADHRRRPQPAADDEAAAGQPRAPHRHQRPDRALLHPRGGRRDQDRGADPPRRPAEVRPARRAFPALPRRRGGDRRPGRAQPRHDRRLALPGRRGRGPLVRLHGGQGDGRHPRRRGERAVGMEGSTSGPT